MSNPVNVDLGFVHKVVPGPEGQAAALLLLHGTGGDENDLLGLGKLIAPGYAMVSPRGKVLENGMPRFFKRLAEGVFDQKDLELRTTELAAFIERARDEYGVDRLIAVGFSNGANIASSVLFRHPGLLSGAILIRAMVPFIPEPTKLNHKPVLLLNGYNDHIVPAANAEQLATLFRERGADVTVKWEQGGHTLTQQDVVAARDWLRLHFPD